MEKEFSLKKLEDAIKQFDDEHPEQKSGLTWYKTGMCNSKGEPLFLVDLGGHAYIGGTKEQLEDRIKRFYKHLISLL